MGSFKSEPTYWGLVMVFETNMDGFAQVIVLLWEAAPFGENRYYGEKYVLGFATIFREVVCVKATSACIPRAKVSQQSIACNEISVIFFTCY